MNPDKMRSAEDYSYARYQNMGGILSEVDYNSALARAKDIKTIKPGRLLGAKEMASVAGITLLARDGKIDPRAALYTVLRVDPNLAKEQYHHSLTHDQQLFAEVLRMVGDTESLRKFVAAYPYIFPEGK